MIALVGLAVRPRWARCLTTNTVDYPIYEGGCQGFSRGERCTWPPAVDNPMYHGSTPFQNHSQQKNY